MITVGDSPGRKGNEVERFWYWVQAASMMAGATFFFLNFLTWFGSPRQWGQSNENFLVIGLAGCAAVFLVATWARERSDDGG